MSAGTANCSSGNSFACGLASAVEGSATASVATDAASSAAGLRRGSFMQGNLWGVEGWGGSLRRMPWQPVWSLDSLLDREGSGGRTLGAMSNELQDTVALVTGASSGIGEATARALAAHGSTVAVAARRKDRLDALAGEIGGLAIEADVTDRAQAQAAVERTAQELGRLDTVINNAGVMLLGQIVDAPVEEWDRMIDLNLKGLLYVAHAALPHLLRAADSEPRRVADLVNVSSVAGRVARLGSGVYNLTKHGVGAFTESLRQEVTQRHVGVSLVAPRAVAHELTSPLRPEIQEIAAQRFAGMEVLAAGDIADGIA